MKIGLTLITIAHHAHLEPPLRLSLYHLAPELAANATEHNRLERLEGSTLARMPNSITAQCPAIAAVETVKSGTAASVNGQGISWIFCLEVSFPHTSPQQFPVN